MSAVLKDMLKKIADQQSLSREEAGAAMHEMMRGEAEKELIAAFLVGLRSRGETIAELVGFTETMRAYAVPVRLVDQHAIDLCGTGGDGSGTFNISTAAAFVCAGAGVTVAKHGNRSVSSKCGSSDVLASLGVETELRAPGVEHCLEEAGIAFLFAPLFHPALGNVMPVRRMLGVRTFFNILGPLCNPAGVRRQLVGSFSVDVARMMADILRELGAEYSVCVSSDDGLDEFAISSPSTYFTFDKKTGHSTSEATFEPESAGLKRSDLASLRGGDAVENAAIIRAILSGDERGPKRDVVILNAAFGLMTSGRFDSIRTALNAAEASIDGGTAAGSLAALVTASREALNA